MVSHHAILLNSPEKLGKTWNEFSNSIISEYFQYMKKWFSDCIINLNTRISSFFNKINLRFLGIQQVVNLLNHY